MGTFQGHLLPGSLFAVLALWWTVQITKRVLICSQKSIPFYNTATYSGFWGRCLTLPVEGIAKVSLTAVGMSLEILASTDYGHQNHIVFWGDIQHVTMYLFFCLSGIADILRHKKFICAPPGLDYAMLSLAFGVEFLLFKFHLHGRDSLDVLVHTLLLFATAGCVIATIFEYKHPTCVLNGYVRAFFVLLQGMWFIQVGFILYPPFPSMTHWDGENHKQMMVATMMFAWHCAGAAVLMFIVGTVARCFYTRYCSIREGTLEYDMVGMEAQMTMTSSGQIVGGRYETIGGSDDVSDSEEEETTVYEQAAMIKQD